MTERACLPRLPAAAEGLIEGDKVQETCVLDLDESLPREIEAFLCGGQVESAVHAAAEAGLDEFAGLFVGMTKARLASSCVLRVARAARASATSRKAVWTAFW